MQDICPLYRGCPLYLTKMFQMCQVDKGIKIGDFFLGRGGDQEVSSNYMTIVLVLSWLKGRRKKESV